jgi:hypothetical protein
MGREGKAGWRRGLLRKLMLMGTRQKCSDGHQALLTLVCKIFQNKLRASVKVWPPRVKGLQNYTLLF